jgi:hypothetical protein
MRKIAPQVVIEAGSPASNADYAKMARYFRCQDARGFQPVARA